MRTFIALELPEQVRKEIFNEFKKLENSGFIVGNFVSKDNLHLTLKFLGTMTEERIEGVKKRLSDLNFSEFEVKTGDVGYFPSERYVRVIWVDLLADEIFKLKEEIDRSLKEIGINNDNRDFKSHITSTRVKNVKDKENFLKLLKELRVKKMNFPVDKVVLIKSELTRSGPVYKILEEFKLQ